jgi:HEAT repeat protein
MSTTSRTKIIPHIKALESDKNAEVMRAVQALRDSGTEEAIPFLVHTLVHHPSEEIKNEIGHLLFDLKNEKALPGLILAIQNPENKEYKSLLISACWESGLNCTPFLKEFVDIAINSDYHETIESLTVIENMIGPFNAEDLEESISIVRNAADDDDVRFPLLNSLWEVLVDFRQE